MPAAKMWDQGVTGGRVSIRESLCFIMELECFESEQFIALSKVPDTNAYFATTFAYLNTQVASQIPDAFVLGTSPPHKVRFLAI